jgi:hypothetical protein
VFARAKIGVYTKIIGRAYTQYPQSERHEIPTRTEIEQCYRILELDPDASSSHVERSWRKLTDEWRPDRFVSDAVLHHLAQARVKDLNQAHEQLKGHLANEPAPVSPPTSRTAGFARRRHSFHRRSVLASSVLAGVAIAAVMIARQLYGENRRPANVSPASSSPVPVVPRPVASPKSEMLLVAHAPLTVSVSLVADGRILLPATDILAGQTITVPRLGPTYVQYSAGESLEVEIDGRRYTMPDTGASRAKIN